MYGLPSVHVDRDIRQLPGGAVCGERSRIDPGIVVGVIILPVHDRSAAHADGVGRIGLQSAQRVGIRCAGRHGELLKRACRVVKPGDHILLRARDRCPADFGSHGSDPADLHIGHTVREDAVGLFDRAVIVPVALHDHTSRADLPVILPGQEAVGAVRAVGQLQRLAAVLQRGRRTDGRAEARIEISVAHVRHGERRDVRSLPAANGADMVFIPGVPGVIIDVGPGIGFAAGLARRLAAAVRRTGALALRGHGPVQHAVFIRVEHLIAAGEPAGLDGAVDQIDRVVRAGERCPAGVVRDRDGLGAVGAPEHVTVRVIDPRDRVRLRSGYGCGGGGDHHQRGGNRPGVAAGGAVSARQGSVVRALRIKAG